MGLDLVLDALPDRGTENIEVFLLDDEDDAVETGALGVENRVVDDEMAGLVDRLDLLKAPEAAAHPGGENH